MAAVIKNIPNQTFGIQGNRGLFFPILGHLVENFISPLQTSRDCYLQKEQNDLAITSETETDILVICGDVVNEQADPNNLDCYLANEEDSLEAILQTPIDWAEGEPIIVQCDNDIQ